VDDRRLVHPGRVHGGNHLLEGDRALAGPDRPLAADRVIGYFFSSVEMMCGWMSTILEAMFVSG